MVCYCVVYQSVCSKFMKKNVATRYLLLLRMKKKIFTFEISTCYD